MSETSGTTPNTVPEPIHNPPPLVIAPTQGTGDGGGKSNWALILSLVSPFVMAIGLISGFSIYKERVDLITEVISPEFLVEYGGLLERVRELEDEVEFLQGIVRDEYLKADKK